MYKVFSRQAGTQEHTGAWGLTGRQVGRQLGVHQAGGRAGRWGIPEIRKSQEFIAQHPNQIRT